MESEVDDLGLDVTSPVSISITRPSASEDEEDQETGEGIGSPSETMDLEDSVLKEDDNSEKGQRDESEKKKEELVEEDDVDEGWDEDGYGW